jgi:putative oxidoreductase
MVTIDPPSTAAPNSGLLPTAASAATCLRLTLAAYWIIHWWFKVGVSGMPATEILFVHNGLPAWLAWFDVSFEIVVALCLILGLYVSVICIVSLPIIAAGIIIYRFNGFYFPTGGIEFPIFWAVVQIIQALLGPGRFRIASPAWLPRISKISSLEP